MTTQTQTASAVKTQGEITAYAEPINLRKRIGSTVYTVTVHFSKTSRETAEDKILRLIESEVRHSA